MGPLYMEDLAAVLISVTALLMLFLYIYSISWAAGDAERRGSSGCLVALLVALLNWPLGLLLWVIFRPKGDRRM